MKSVPTVTELSLRTYPKWWRERYRDEMQAVVDGLIEEGKSSISLAVNLIGGSLRARMLGTGAPTSARLWTRRTQTALLVATLPWFAMIPLIAVFAATTGEYGSFHGGANATRLRSPRRQLDVVIAKSSRSRSRRFAPFSFRVAGEGTLLVAGRST